LAYCATVCWGMGLPRVGWPLTAAITVLTVAALIAGTRGGNTALRSLNSLGELASALLLGSTFSAMLLGHHYLIAPNMSIAPLRAGCGWRFAVATFFGAGGSLVLVGG